MNRLRNIFFCLCPALLLAWGQGRAQTVVWSDGFETNVPSRWTNTGAWHVSSPTTGPALNGGYRTHSGAKCASTQNYAYNQDGRIVCTNYVNGGSSLVIPDAVTSPTLTFWHWVNLANALGYVELRSGTNDWQQISPTYLDVTSGGAWLQESVALSAYAGQSVQIAFHFTSGGCCGNALGWYVDDVALTMQVTPPPEVTGPGDQTIDAGDLFEDTVSATNIYAPNANYTYKLIAKPVNALINATNGTVTWPTTNTMMPGTNLFVVRVTDDSSPIQIVTNSFTITVRNPWLPIVTVPGAQTAFPGRTLTATNFAANDFSSSAFTFTLLAGPTNQGLFLAANGVITWPVTNTQPAGTFTNIVKATYTGSPSLSGTNSFVIIVSTNLPAPVLTVPVAQTLYGGQSLSVSVSATNTTFPDHMYFYKTNVLTPAGVVLNSTNGKLTWLPVNAQWGKNYTISIRAVDQQATNLTATNKFTVTVKLDALLPATFTAAPQRVSTTNGFRFTLSAQPSLTWRIDGSSNLLTWQPLFTNLFDASGSLSFTDAVTTNSLRYFYRAVLP